MWSVKKGSYIYSLSATLTSFFHKVNKTIKLKSGLFSKIYKVVSCLNSVFRENEIRIRFSYRGGNVKIIHHYYNFRMGLSSQIFTRIGLKGITPLKRLNKKILSVKRLNFPKRGVSLFSKILDVLRILS